MVDDPKDGNEEAAKPEGEDKPAPKKRTTKRAVAARKTTEPKETPKAEETGSENAKGSAGPGTGDMNWDKAKAAMSEVDWGSRGYQLKRGVLMILAVIAAWVSRSFIGIMAVANFVYVMITLERLQPLSDLSGRIAAYIHQLYDFIGYHSDEPVWPFAPFPEAAEREKAD